MKKKIYVSLLAFMMSFAVMGCGKKASETGASDTKESVVSENSEIKECPLEDGVYVADFDTDSGMFHVNESNEGKGILTVKDGEMTIHVSLQSTGIINLYPGLAEDAQKDGAMLLMPTTDVVTYSDGYSEEVYGFDVPVPYLDEEFDLALIGKKGVWYDHKVSVSNPVPGDDIKAVIGNNETSETPEEVTTSDAGLSELADGEYKVETTLEGGSGKATIESPAVLTVSEGKTTLTVVWSSPNYDYMIVGDTKYLPVNTEGNSVFEIPVDKLGEPMDVVADTVAMSTPHEIEYTITCVLKEE